ncbi:hypothetical protein TNCV_4401731 [Trichonephila clavipes]|nr:hypothetical protein TNCV_4401731 [Trichonephila clavipes]
MMCIPFTARHHGFDDIGWKIIGIKCCLRTSPFKFGIAGSFLLVQDNASPHTARLAEKFLESEAIKRIRWSACFTNLNPIKYMWTPSDDAVLQNGSLLFLSKT